MQPISTDDRRTTERTDAAHRRTRLRLRDLCDEVLASYRVAQGQDPLSAEDRAAAESMLDTVSPRRSV